VSELRGKAVLVTGGASGLGREVALQAAAEGARIALMDVREDRLAAAREQLGGADCLVVRADVTAEDDVVRTVREVDAWGPLDAVVNSAGVVWRGPLVETTMAQYDRMHAVNVRGLYMVCREAARVMLPRGRGHIVNIASIAAKRGVVDESAYASGKWAVLGLSECLALELGPQGIRVTTVCPGGMNTTFWEGDARLGGGADHLLNPAHVAKAVVQILGLPEGVVVKEALVYQPGR
jgi:NAD(P)-dependent dehydrogenase (short-subunit alcohol dehydrogenase family)